MLSSPRRQRALESAEEAAIPSWANSSRPDLPNKKWTNPSTIQRLPTDPRVFSLRSPRQRAGVPDSARWRPGCVDPLRRIGRRVTFAASLYHATPQTSIRPASHRRFFNQLARSRWSGSKRSRAPHAVEGGSEAGHAAVVAPAGALVVEGQGELGLEAAGGQVALVVELARVGYPLVDQHEAREAADGLVA